MLAPAIQKYEGLMLELACRKGNEHVGSGLGGNPEQYLTMLALTPHFINSNSENLFTINGELLEISVEKMQKVSKKDMRFALDKTLTSDVISKYTSKELVDFISGAGPAPSDENLFAPKQKGLIKVAKLATRMKELVILELKDSGEVPALTSLSTELQQVYSDLKSQEKWLILFGCRAYIGLETMVKYNLDEIFGEMFNQINSATSTP